MPQRIIPDVLQGPVDSNWLLDTAWRTPTFMATMDVPQKKKGDMSRSRAPNCCSVDEVVCLPVGNFLKIHAITCISLPMVRQLDNESQGDASRIVVTFCSICCTIAGVSAIVWARYVHSCAHAGNLFLFCAPHGVCIGRDSIPILLTGSAWACLGKPQSTYNGDVEYNSPRTCAACSSPVGPENHDFPTSASLGATRASERSSWSDPVHGLCTLPLMTLRDLECVDILQLCRRGSLRPAWHRPPCSSSMLASHPIEPSTADRS